MATKKKAAPKKPARPRAARYVVVTVNDVATGVLPLKHSAAEEKCVRCALDAMRKLAKMPRYPAVGETVVIKIHGTTAQGFIGGPGNEELPESLTVPPGIFKTEDDVMSRTVPMTPTEAKVAKRGRR